MTIGRRDGFALIMLALMLLLPTLTVARWRDRTPDASAIHTQATVLTDDVAPGDELAIRVQSFGGLRSWIQVIRARVDAGAENVCPGELGTAWQQTTEEDDDTVTVTIVVPPTVSPGPARVTLEIDLVWHRDKGRAFGTVYYAASTQTEQLQVPLVVRSATERSDRRLATLRNGGLAWLIACFIAYSLARWLPVPGARLPRRRSQVVAVVIGLVPAIALGALGERVFVAPMLGTIARPSFAITVAIQGAWAVALVAGAWRGLVRRPAPFYWRRARVRAVVGAAHAGGYREPGTVLPAFLSREAPACSAVQLVAAMEHLGCTATRRHSTLRVSCDGEPVVEIRARGPGPWRPEELAFWVRDGIDAHLIIRELSKSFGSLEYQPPAAAAMIIDPPVQP